MPSKLITLGNPETGPSAKRAGVRILLLRAPYFTPWTPPLGIATLKAFLEENGHVADCADFNADPELWGMHHKYFAALASASPSTGNDGYSRMWWVLNAHMLACLNGARAEQQTRLIEIVSGFYGIRITNEVTEALVSLAGRYFRRLEFLFEQLDLSGYDYLGASTYTTSLASSLWILRRGKEKRPDIRTVIGGGVFADDLALGSENLEILQKEFPFIDHIVVGEGEKLLELILSGPLSGKRVVSLADLNGSTVAMKDVPTPDFSDFDLSRYYQLTIEGARSCPFQCSFCSETIQWGEYRKKPVERLVDQVIGLADKCGIREFFMGDSLMNPYLIPFAESLIRQNARIIYDGYLRADRPVTHWKFVSTWAQSGLYRVRLGIESASNQVLEAMDKKTTPAVIEEVLKTLSRAGIRTTTYWIAGFAGETEENFEETCEFVRKNHRWIYELEAHPYYYYPYGQVDSRLYQCESVYPEEVTRLTKFKVWEIINANPPRATRYDRLDRISSLAASLGIPNIYTMEERYRAEERWRLLHPASRQVYVPPAAAGGPGNIAPIRMPGDRDTGGVLIYRLSASHEPGLETIRQSILELIDHFEMLRVNDAGIRVESPAERIAPAALVRRATRPEGVTAEDFRRKTTGELSGELAASDAGPLRVAVCPNGGVDGATELIIVARRRFLDARSVAILAEDICRASDRSLASAALQRSVRKSYADYAARTPGGPVGVSSIPPAPADIRFFGIPVPEKLLAGLSPLPALRPASSQRLITATLRTLGCSGAERVDVVLDRRILDEGLDDDIGPFAAMLRWPHGRSPAENLATDLTLCGDVLKKLGSNSTYEPPKQASGSAQATLNLEYFVEDAWMGVDGWASHGFIIAPSQLPWSAPVQIVPVIHGRQMEIMIACEQTAEALALASRIADSFIETLSETMEEHIRLVRAEKWWEGETGVRGANRATELPAPASRFLNSVTIAMPPGWNALATQSGSASDSALAAIYLLALSRLTGDSEAALVEADGGAGGVAPLRPGLAGRGLFSELVKSTQDNIQLGREHSRYGWLIARYGGYSGSFRHACIYGDPGPGCGDDPALPAAASQLLLHTALDLRGPSRRLFYDPLLMNHDTAELLAATISSALRRAHEIPQLRLSDLFWEADEWTSLVRQPDSGAGLDLEFQFGA